MSCAPSSTTPNALSDFSAPSATADLMEHLFRRHAGQVVARLTRQLGPANLQLAEDVVQEALIKALRQWSFGGPPTNPGGWIYRVARNQAIDVLRREQRFQALDELEDGTGPSEIEFEGDAGFGDDQLTLMFLCCHPAISPDAAVALTLKTVGGFGVPEIARAYFAEETNIRQRLVRAKRVLRGRNVDLALPNDEALRERLDAVLRVLYLMFSGGHSAPHGDQAIREDICAEAIRLTSLLAASAVGDTPRSHALLALMLLQAARIDARTDTAGDLVLLDEQDRSRWNQAMLACGFEQLARSAEGDELSDYHLEAGIAACHAVASTHGETDWARIVEHYDLLLERTQSAVVALNRAIAVATLRGPAAGEAALAEHDLSSELVDYHLYQATAGELARQRSDYAAAVAAFERASELTINCAERRLLERRIAACRLALGVPIVASIYEPGTPAR